ncbi:MAG: biopolymer transporter ExbD [Bacteroidia bacterium]|nr:biopolymer transporter ExbD [Bacteroidales bacterium]NCD42048.1 biopolymer transporter ExbD [Bacteroidia bacterium]MDD2324081.1 biopolymer transporter ExbD [Bacteroidales bacterium]MDD3961187.1 biopolymer transporter ExbD [Bacteroidales bacterium]MDY0284611.1 biopolymer transporter ExbD [Bacteroidales bacterium]
MALRVRNKKRIEFNMSSMSDLVFLLLIFFMLTSTLVSPNAVKLLLPSSNSKTLAKPASVTVYIDSDLTYYVDGVPVNKNTMVEGLSRILSNQLESSVVVRAEKTVEIQALVDVIDAVNEVNRLYDSKHKIILATKPRK